MFRYRLYLTAQFQHLIAGFPGQLRYRYVCRLQTFHTVGKLRQSRRNGTNRVRYGIYRLYALAPVYKRLFKIFRWCDSGL